MMPETTSQLLVRVAMLEQRIDTVESRMEQLRQALEREDVTPAAQARTARLREQDEAADAPQ